MRFLFELNHPKHYHQFKNLIKLITTDENDLLVLARDKDVLVTLIKEDKIKFKIIGKPVNSLLAKFLVIPELLYNYYRIALEFKPDIILSKASPYASIIGKLLKIPTVITPDSEIVTLTNKFVVPLTTCIITQNTFGNDYGKRHKKISAFFEATYLHPNYFIPSETEIYNERFTKDNKFFVLRFIGWDANHDIKQFGFTIDEKRKLVEFLSKFGKVIITSEKKLPADLIEYAIKIDPIKIHHLLSFADLYIGDSQSMATEACLLGTPAIRYNSFVGNNDMSNFKILQERYNMLYNCESFNEVIESANEILNDKISKQKWLSKKTQYFSEIGDPNKEILEIITKVVNN